MSRGRFWVFTLNLSPDIDHDALAPQLWPGCRYCIYSLEMGETGNLHYQGYAEFHNTKRLAALKNLDAMEGAHWELRRGSQKDAMDYCRKTDDPTYLDGPYEWGEPSSGQGARSDLKALKIAIDEGSTDVDLFDNFFPTMLRYHKSVSHYRNLKQVKRSWKTLVTVCIGPTGTGKSSYAFNNYPDAYYAPMDGWFDSYQGQETVIVDEMYGSRYSWSFMLQLCDRWPLLAKSKGGFVNFTARNIIFTSNVHPSQWYPKVVQHTGWEASPLARRIDLLLYFPALGTPPLKMDSFSLPNLENQLVRPELYN